MDYEQKISAHQNPGAHEWSPVEAGGHKKSSAEIERDIGHTRNELDAIIDEIGKRIHPKRVLNQAIDSLRHAGPGEKADLFGMGRQVADRFQKNPIPFVLTGIGLAWLAWDMQHRTELRSESLANEDRRKAQQAGTGASGAIASGKERAGQAKEAAKEAGREIGGTLESATERLSTGYRQGAQKADRVFDQNPLAMGLVAMFFGSMAAMLIPQSSQEEDLFGEKAVEVKRAASEKIDRVSEKSKEVLKESARAGAEKSRQEGLTPEQAAKAAKEKTEELVHR